MSSEEDPLPSTRENKSTLVCKPLTDQNLEEWCDIAKQRNTATHVDVNVEQCSPAGISQFLATLAESLKRITLILEYSDDEMMETFASFFQQSGSVLYRFKLVPKGKASASGLKPFVSALAKDNSLVHLRILCPLQYDVAFKLGNEVLPVNTALKSLDVRFADVSTVQKGIVSLMSGLEKNTSVTSFFAGSSHLTDLDVYYIARMLYYRTDMRELYLENNMITDQGAHYLAHGLQGERSFVQLAVQDNYLGDTGVNKLIQGSRACSNQVTVGMHRNGTSCPYEEGGLISYPGSLTNQSSVVLFIKETPHTLSGDTQKLFSHADDSDFTQAEGQSSTLKGYEGERISAAA